MSRESSKLPTVALDVDTHRRLTREAYKLVRGKDLDIETAMADITRAALLAHLPKDPA